MHDGIATRARAAAGVPGAEHPSAAGRLASAGNRPSTAPPHPGVDAVIAADIGCSTMPATHHPDLALHLPVQALQTSYEALRFYHERFSAVAPCGTARAVTGTGLQVIEHSPIQIEVFGRQPVRDGRRTLPVVVVCGRQVPNTHGCCSPAAAVEDRDA